MVRRGGLDRGGGSGDDDAVNPSSPQARPVAEFVVPTPPEQVVDRFARALGEAGCPVAGAVLSGHVDLYVREDDQHFWSPWLSIEVRREVDGTHVRGRFGPHPHVWTMFVAIYAVLGFGGVIALMYGLAQLTMGDPAWALLGLPAAGALAAFVLGAEFIGKGLGSEQMWVIRDFVVRTLGLEGA